MDGSAFTLTSAPAGVGSRPARLPHLMRRCDATNPFITDGQGDKARRMKPWCSSRLPIEFSLRP
jgi:hypothetical protein